MSKIEEVQGGVFTSVNPRGEMRKRAMVVSE